MSHATLPPWTDATATEKLDKLRALIDDLYRYQLAERVESVVALLERHSSADEKEARDVASIIAMCRAHPNIFSPLCEPGHITGSALIVHPAGARVLLNHHRKFDRWMQFGGHMDNDLAPHLTALREGREETGLEDLRFHVAQGEPRPFDVDVHMVPRRGDRPEHLHLDLRYLLATDRPEDARPTDESNDIRWFTLEEMKGLDLAPGVWRMIAKWRARE
jgi:8-oxo-dGTP pyrophosphatase MutT (NUDIX family)